MSHKAYIENVFVRFRLKDCAPAVVLIVERDKYSKDQCPRNVLEQEQMKSICNRQPKVCTRSTLDLTLDWQYDYWVNTKAIQIWNIRELQIEYYGICKEPRTIA